MTELRPCPFQKPGEVHRIEAVETRAGYGYIFCQDCGFFFPGEDEIPGAELFERWNTRTERTCDMDIFPCEISFNDQPLISDVSVVCDYCGFTGRMHDEPSYCPHCGAKVVSE